MIVLLCTVTTNDSRASIEGVGLILNNSDRKTLGASYIELSGHNKSVSPSLNLPTNGLGVGDTVWGVVTGEAKGQHFFFEKSLKINTCA